MNIDALYIGLYAYIMIGLGCGIHEFINRTRLYDGSPISGIWVIIVNLFTWPIGLWIGIYPNGRFRRMIQSINR